MDQIFGKFYYNKNLAIEFSRFFDFRLLLKLLVLNKKFHDVYGQDMILWIVLQSSFPQIRCAENFLFQDKKLDKSSASKAFKEVQQCVQQLNANKGYKVPDSHHFLVHVQGLLGKLPVQDDIKATCGPNFDLLSAFQTYFVFEGDIYALTTYSCPLDKYGSFIINEIDCFLVLGNENLYLSRKDCDDTLKLIVEKNISNVVMLRNTGAEKDKDMWENQMESELPKKSESEGGVERLQEYLKEKNETVVSVDNLSHHNISLIFNHILKACILHRKSKGFKTPDVDKIQDQQEQEESKTQELKNKKCIIF